jgi:hypothetical protein
MTAGRGNGHDVTSPHRTRRQRRSMPERRLRSWAGDGRPTPRYAAGRFANGHRARSDVTLAGPACADVRALTSFARRAGPSCLRTSSNTWSCNALRLPEARRTRTGQVGYPDAGLSLCAGARTCPRSRRRAVRRHWQARCGRETSGRQQSTGGELGGDLDPNHRATLARESGTENRPLTRHPEVQESLWRSGGLGDRRRIAPSPVDRLCL